MMNFQNSRPQMIRVVLFLVLLLMAFYLQWEKTPLHLLPSSSFVETKHDTLGTKKHGETDINSPSSSSSSSSLRPIIKTEKIAALERRHPHCFSDQLFIGLKNDKRRIHLAKVGRYKLMGRNVSYTGNRYDHQCPYYVKDRYNCARNSSDVLAYGENPTDWKLVLKPGEKEEECNLWDFIHGLGGPIGVSQAVAAKRKREVRSSSNPNGTSPRTSNEEEFLVGGMGETTPQEERPFTVLMMGNSYLRQVFEALACAWSAGITDFRASINQTACYSLKCIREMEESGKTTVGLEEIGDFLPPLVIPEELRIPNTAVQRFYRPGVMLPMKVLAGGRISDALAMVEFGHSIRFYYVFRPYLHSNLTAVFDEKLGLDPADVHVLIFNDGQEKTLQRDNNKGLKRAFESTGAWQRRSLWPYPEFKNVQQKSIGKWFGADNPWIYEPPDGHACMPGPPDDEVNLLLFLIFWNSRIVS